KYPTTVHYRDLEDALAAGVDCGRVFDLSVDVPFLNAPKKYASTNDHTPIFQAAFKIRVALFDHWHGDLVTGHLCQAEFRELVNFRSGAVADPHDRIDEVDRGQIDDTLLAFSDQVEAVILVPDVAADPVV